MIRQIVLLSLFAVISWSCKGQATPTDAPAPVANEKVDAHAGHDHAAMAPAADTECEKCKAEGRDNCDCPKNEAECEKCKAEGKECDCPQRDEVKADDADATEE